MMTVFRVFTVFALGVSSFVFTQESRADKFHPISLCGFAERVRLNCSQEEPGVSSSIECHIRCLSDQFCNRVSVGNDGTCYLHKSCPYPLECNAEDANLQHTEKHCLHGTWNTSTQSCNCFENIVGDRCHIHPATCLPIDDGQYVRTFVDPEQTGENPIPVSCTGSVPDLVVLKTKGRVSFNKTWNEYKRGFYIDESHHWLGLDNWHRLSNSGCNKMNFYLEIWPNNSRTFRIHRDFAMTDEANTFQYSFSTMADFKNNMPFGGYFIQNCFREIEDTPFSTWDNDNDGDAGVNCAARAGSGWWYLPGCVNICNVLGQGFGLWDTTPPEQQLYLDGKDLVQLIHEESLFRMTLFDCP